MRNESAAFQFAHTVYVSYTTASGDQFPETFSTPNVDIGNVVRASKVANAALVPANVTGIFLIIDSMPAGIIISSVLLEKVGALDSYFDGSFPNSSWDGAVDLSTSTFSDVVAGPTASLWTGSAEVPLTVHLWDGATEVPLTIDSII